MEQDTSAGPARKAGPRMEPSDSVPGPVGTSGEVRHAPATGVPDGIEWSGVSPNLRWYRVVVLAGVLVPVAAAGATAGGIWLGPTFVLVWSFLILAGAGIGLTHALWIVRHWHWAEGPAELFVAHGVLVRQVIAVPYGRIQIVDATANPLEWWFGIATLRVHTAATTVDAYVCGLPEAGANELRDRLARRSETYSTGL